MPPSPHWHRPASVFKVPLCAAEARFPFPCQTQAVTLSFACQPSPAGMGFVVDTRQVILPRCRFTGLPDIL
jgi:hypothetical protein